jgi:hypothetical protein
MRARSVAVLALSGRASRGADLTRTVLLATGILEEVPDIPGFAEVLRTTPHTCPRPACGAGSTSAPTSDPAARPRRRQGSGGPTSSRCARSLRPRSSYSPAGPVRAVPVSASAAAARRVLGRPTISPAPLCRLRDAGPRTSPQRPSPRPAERRGASDRGSVVGRLIRRRVRSSRWQGPWRAPGLEFAIRRS